MADVEFYVGQQVHAVLQYIKDKNIPYDIIRNADGDDHILRAKFPTDEISLTGFMPDTEVDYLVLEIYLYSSPGRSILGYSPYTITIPDEKEPDYQLIPAFLLSNLYTE